MKSLSSASETLLLSSSSPSSSSLPRLSLQRPELQAEFLQVCRDKFLPHSDVSDSGAVSSPSPPPSSPFSSTPSSPRSSSSSPCCDDRRARLSLSSPELLSELKDSRTRSLRHVSAHNGLTIVFSGRGRGGRQAFSHTPFTRPTNQKTSY